MGVWTVPCCGTLGCCPGWGGVLRVLCCAGLWAPGGCDGDTGYPGVLCCTRLLDLGPVSWDTRGCCAVPEEKCRGPSPDHNPCSASVSPVLHMGWAPQGPWVPKDETWGSTRRILEEQGPESLSKDRGHSHSQSQDRQGPCVYVSLVMLREAPQGSRMLCLGKLRHGGRRRCPRRGS